MENNNSSHGPEDSPVAKRLKTDDGSENVQINVSYLESDFVKSLSDAFCNKEKIIFENGAKIINEPFTCCVLPDFIQPNDFTDQLKKDVEELEVELKLSDLYQFKQSKDLATCKTTSISHLK
ncbi:hypothetical protein AVEN_248793-1 [Araneus ventricosus]|uniref:Uncharacterized protein n=1 Tax=Araneus ventricosus TaxID=182803 RepID=A0A4Y2QD74_ARAVE|nr:hypothetical protein AVEN_74385-1 [Araneus ventricosus]GBN62583.1 hypothetical protein AVEN_48407-1 [Araneus ventricosus]GBN92513.1 hypothetical protein AVEN_269474-1 [Araneus ventricosus]GBN92620.1 hypothetical protein AVEN_248793-1 [Araneus ventricosus]